MVHSNRSFDAGAEIFRILTAVLMHATNSARASVNKKGGDSVKVGKLLVNVGWTLLWFSIMAGFQSGLMSCGQLSIVAGQLLHHGFTSAWRLVFKPSRLRGTVFCIVGFALILLHYTILGCALEAIGYMCIHGYDHILIV